MQELTADDIRASFINATERELDMLDLPLESLLVDWYHLDFFAWQDASNRSRCYVIAEVDGVPAGVILRAAGSSSRSRSGMCNICRTMQPGNQVVMMSARKGGEAGEREESIATYMCADVSCHENVRIAHPLAPDEYRTNVDFRIDSTAGRMISFIRQVRDAV